MRLGGVWECPLTTWQTSVKFAGLFCELVKLIISKGPGLCLFSAVLLLFFNYPGAGLEYSPGWEAVKDAAELLVSAPQRG